MIEYIIEMSVNEYLVFKIEGKHEILVKIFKTIPEIEAYIILKNGIIKKFR